jgi:hypothetical protein
MMRQFGFLIGVLILQTWFVSTGYSADTDKKIISASACQVTDPEDRGKLAYRVRGIVAQADIQITCPITRDSTGKDNPLNWLDARYQRGWSIPPQGSDKDQFMGQFKGTVWSCSNGAAGLSECTAAEGESHGHPDTSDATSVHIETRSLPHDTNRYFVYQTTLPKFAVLKSIAYQEEGR